MVVAVWLGDYLLYGSIVFRMFVFTASYFWYKVFDAIIAVTFMVALNCTLVVNAIPSLAWAGNLAFGIAVGGLLPGIIYLILYLMGVLTYIYIKVPVNLADFQQEESKARKDFIKTGETFKYKGKYKMVKIRLNSTEVFISDLKAAGIPENVLNRFRHSPFFQFVTSEEGAKQRKKVGIYLIISTIGAVISALLQIVPETLCLQDPYYWPQSKKAKTILFNLTNLLNTVFGWWSHGMWHLGMAWSLGTIAQAILYNQILGKYSSSVEQRKQVFFFHCRWQVYPDNKEKGHSGQWPELQTTPEYFRENLLHPFLGCRIRVNYRKFQLFRFHSGRRPT